MRTTSGGLTLVLEPAGSVLVELVRGVAPPPGGPFRLVEEAAAGDLGIDVDWSSEVPFVGLTGSWGVVRFDGTLCTGLAAGTYVLADARGEIEFDPATVEVRSGATERLQVRWRRAEREGAEDGD